MRAEPNTGSSKWPRAAVFDFDGLLADTGDLWRYAFARSLDGAGRALTPDVLPSLAGASVQQAALRLEVPAPELRRHLAEAFNNRPLRLMPGAARVVQQLRSRIPLAIATNAPEEVVRNALSRLGLLDCFRCIVSAETGALREKPHPDVYSEACRALGVQPNDAVAFEDSPIGVRAAREAGLIVVHVPSDGQIADAAHLRVNRLSHPELFTIIGHA
jgi:HAD superfamily hydrolase (TIGR01509 family)